MTFHVKSGEQSYDVTVERGCLQTAGTALQLDRKVLVVTDDGVPAQLSERVAAQCKDPTVVCLPQGEKSKNLDTFRLLLQKMLHASFTRRDCVVAVGGGVVGDLCGFAASCYMRGIDFYNIPTTLLSQIDSSIGGKTAVDLDGVKNAVGTFYPPKKVLVDPDVLTTLDPRQLHAGLAEAIKIAMTFDQELFALIEHSSDLTADLPQIIRRSVALKQAVVEKDPTEKGLRQVLNFGHTFGHAIESCFGGTMLHGECVAAGMVPMCAPRLRPRLKAVLEKYGLPTGTGQSTAELLPYLTHDKKSGKDSITAVYVEEIGSFRLQETPVPELVKLWEATL